MNYKIRMFLLTSKIATTTLANQIIGLFILVEMYNVGFQKFIFNYKQKFLLL